MLALSPEYEVKFLRAADYANGGLDGIDFLIQPGGSCKGQYEAIGTNGIEKLRKYVLEGGKYYVCPFGAKILVTGDKADGLAQKGIGSRKVLLGVRPEHIVLADQPGPDAIPCKLEVNEMMGSELHLHVYTADETRLIVRVPTINLSLDQRKELKYGKQLYITFEGKVMHFFDPETTKNLIYD